MNNQENKRSRDCKPVTATIARELIRVLAYNADSGLLYWTVNTAHNVKAGEEAGHKRKDGYIIVRFKGRAYLAHRLAWLLATGKWSKKALDHMNGNRGDNRLINLRQVSLSENQQNQRRAHRNSRSGFLGVVLACSKRNPWKAQIVVDGEQQYLGCFASAETAHQAYVAAKRKFHPGCTL